MESTDQLLDSEESAKATEHSLSCRHVLTAEVALITLGLARLARTRQMIGLARLLFGDNNHLNQTSKNQQTDNKQRWKLQEGLCKRNVVHFGL